MFFVSLPASSPRYPCLCRFCEYAVRSYRISAVLRDFHLLQFSLLVSKLGKLENFISMHFPSPSLNFRFSRYRRFQIYGTHTVIIIIILIIIFPHHSSCFITINSHSPNFFLRKKSDFRLNTINFIIICLKQPITACISAPLHHHLRLFFTPI